MSFVLRNRYEGFILVDAEGFIEFMDRPTEKLFGLPAGGAKGLPWGDFVTGSGLSDVRRSGVPQIGVVQDVRGKRKIVSR